MSQIEIKPNILFHRYFSDIILYHELIFFLGWRDIVVRYKQTLIGVAWSILKPITTIAAFTFVFGVIIKTPSDGVPYPILVMGGTIPWLLFSTGLTQITNSVVTNSNIVTKIYFPRLILPISACFLPVFDTLISAIFLLPLLYFFDNSLSLSILLLPIILLYCILIAFGIGVWTAFLNVKYRDFKFIIPFILQLGLYISPIGFPISAVPEKYLFWYKLNPIVFPIEAFRSCISGTFFNWFELPYLISFSTSMFILFVGSFLFIRSEKEFADFI
jgi:lipopolysaccharide transport system permease protein